MSPPPPLLLLLLLLGCCWKGPPGTPEQARERPPPAIRAATPAAAPAHTLRPSPLLLPPPWQPLWRPHRSVQPLHQTWQRHTGEGRNEAKGRVRGWKWTPEGGQGWGGGGGCARARDGGAEARRSSGRPSSRGRTGPGAHLRRGPGSPMKDKPNRQPGGHRPAGPRIDDPGPPGWGVRIGGAQARAGPTYLRRQGDSHPAAQVRNADRGDTRPCLPRAQPCHLRRAWSACAWRVRVRPRFDQARVALCLRALRAASRPVGPAWRRP